MANLPSQTLGQANTFTPVQDYTPEKMSPSFSGPINEVANVQTYTTTTVNLTAADILKVLLILTNGGAITANMPSAAALIPAIEGAKGGTSLGINPAGGSSVEFDVKAGGAGNVTVAIGAGGTLVGSGGVTAGSVKRFRLVVTNGGTQTPAYTLYSLGQASA